MPKRKLRRRVPSSDGTNMSSVLQRLSSMRRRAHFYARDVFQQQHHPSTVGVDASSYCSSSSPVPSPGGGSAAHRHVFHGVYLCIAATAECLEGLARAVDAASMRLQCTSTVTACYALASNVAMLAQRDLCQDTAYTQLTSLVTQLDAELERMSADVSRLSADEVLIGAHTDSEVNHCATARGLSGALVSCCAAEGSQADDDSDDYDHVLHSTLHPESKSPHFHHRSTGAGNVLAGPHCAEGVDMTRLTPACCGAACSPLIQNRVAMCETILRSVLQIVKGASDRRQQPQLMGFAIFLQRVLLLPSYEVASLAVWYVCLSAALSAAFLLLRLTSAQRITATEVKPLSIGLLMLLGPLVIATLLRLALPRRVLAETEVLLPTVSIGMSVLVPLTVLWGDGSDLRSRDWGCILAYLVATWRLPCSYVVTAIAAALFSLVSVVSLARGAETDAVVEVFEIGVWLGLAMSTGMMIVSPSTNFSVGSLRSAATVTEQLAMCSGDPTGVSAPSESAGQAAMAPKVAKQLLWSRVSPQGSGTAGGSCDVVPPLQLNSSQDYGQPRSYSLHELVNRVAAQFQLQVEVKEASSGAPCSLPLVAGRAEAAQRVLDILFSTIASAKSRGRVSSLQQLAALVPTQVVLSVGEGRVTCDDFLLLSPSLVAVARLESEGSGLQLAFSNDNGIVLRFTTAPRAPSVAGLPHGGSGSTAASPHTPMLATVSAVSTPVSLRHNVPPNLGDETVLVVHPSPAVQLALAQALWDNGIAVCVHSALPSVHDNTSVASFAGIVLPHEMFCIGGIVDDLDLPTLFPYAFVAAIVLPTDVGLLSMPASVSQSAGIVGNSSHVSSSAAAERPHPEHSMPQLSDRLHAILIGLPNASNLSAYQNFILEVRLRSTTRYPLRAPSEFKAPVPVRRLGQGSAGVVHKVRWENGDVAAMKVMRVRSLKRHRLSDDNVYQQEARKTLLRHPNIVNVLHAEKSGTSGGGEIVVFSELCSDVTLRLMLQNGPVSVREAARISADVLCGLEYLHERSAFAGDLKSENVLFGTLRAAKIADYCSAMTTLNWRAPEFRSRQPDNDAEREAADVWALGCLQLEMVWGKDFLPFKDAWGISSQALAVQQQQQDVDRTCERSYDTADTSAWKYVLPERVPSEWRLFIAACLEVDPSHRARLDQLFEFRFIAQSGLHENAAGGDAASSSVVSGRRSTSARLNGHRSEASSVNWPVTCEAE